VHRSAFAPASAGALLASLVLILAAGLAASGCSQREARSGADRASGAGAGGGEGTGAAGGVAAAGPHERTLGRSPDYDYDPPAPGTYRLPRIGPAAGGRILGPDGVPRDLADLYDGRVTILSFIYTRCADPKACPHATGVLHDVHRVTMEDPVLAENLQLLTFSFDPEHDTPQVMADYGERLRTAGSGADWSFLTTDGPGALAPILDAYGQVVDAKKNADDPFGPYYHVLRVYLIDSEREIRNIYSFGLLDPRLLLADARTLLLEKSGTAGAAGGAGTAGMAAKAAG